MPEYRRVYEEGGTYFFTVVTYMRRPMFLQSAARSILRWVWDDVCRRFPFSTEAICLLPDHLHCIWKLPEGDSDYSKRWHEIKRLFSVEYTALMGISENRNESRSKRNETTVWQRRFWEHTVRDEDDLARILDYIHYNPVKHGLVKSISEWQWSSFHRYVKNGLYEPDWGSNNTIIPASSWENRP